MTNERGTGMPTMKEILRAENYKDQLQNLIVKGRVNKSIDLNWIFKLQRTKW